MNESCIIFVLLRKEQHFKYIHIIFGKVIQSIHYTVGSLFHFTQLYTENHNSLLSGRSTLSMFRTLYSEVMHKSGNKKATNISCLVLLSMSDIEHDMNWLSLHRLENILGDFHFYGNVVICGADSVARFLSYSKKFFSSSTHEYVYIYIKRREIAIMF